MAFLQQIPHTQQSSAWKAPERLYPLITIVFAFLLGAPYVWLMPPLQVPDEFAHFFRAYGVSEGYLLPPAEIPVPKSLRDLTFQFPVHLEQRRMISSGELWAASRVPLRESDQIAVRNDGINMYSFVPYLASAAGVRLGRAFTAPALALLYCGRAANLICYVMALGLAVMLAPAFWPLLVPLALMPTALQQAASLSNDAIGFSVALMLTAYALRLAFDESTPRIEHLHHLTMLALAILAGLCKVDIWLIGLALLIPASKFPSPRIRWTAMAAYVCAGAIAAALWNYANQESFRLWAVARQELGINITANWQFAADHPGLFLGALARALHDNSGRYASTLVCGLGWSLISFSPWLVAVYLLVIVLAAATQIPHLRLTVRDRLILLAVVAAGLSSIIIVIWGFETPWKYIEENIALGRGHVPGIQGRHLIPFVAPLLLVMNNSRARMDSRVWTSIAAIVIVVASLSAWATVRRVYYAPFQTSKVAHAGIYRNGTWLLNWNGDPRQAESNRTLQFGGLKEDLPVAGDWDGSGRAKIGIYRAGSWLLDSNGDGQLTGSDRVHHFGGLPDDIPVTGDWLGDGRSKIGIYRSGTWLLDWDGDGRLTDADRVYHFGGLPGDIPIAGDWQGRGHAGIGIYRKGLWLLDCNGDGQLNPEKGDCQFAFGGLAGDVPLAGDWSGRGKASVGIFRQGFLWILDANGNSKLDDQGRDQDPVFPFGGLPGDKPITGNW